MTQPTPEQLRMARECQKKAYKMAVDDVTTFRDYGVQSALLAIQSTEARMAAAVEWQDIAIAPRDGTKFLAFQPGKSGACVVRARTDAMRVDFYRQPQADVCWQELPEARYSHWMPLPPPPTIRSATDG